MEDSRRGDTKCPPWLLGLGVALALGAVCWMMIWLVVGRYKHRSPEGRMLASALADAVGNFHSEYGRLPDLPITMQTDRGPGVKLLEILLAEEGEFPDAENSRQIGFLSASEARGKRGGLDFGPGGNEKVQGFYDLSGHPFHVVLNTGNASELTFKYAGKTVSLRGRQAAVYSAGPDGKLGTKDDPKSW